MSGIPDDIKKAAEEAFRIIEDIPVSVTAVDTKIETIARAILHERERTAKITKRSVDEITKHIVAGRL